MCDAAEVIEKYRDRIRRLEDDIAAIEDAEKEEKELRVTELKANKAHNLLEHREEILARPKRTWFQTHSERMQDIGEGNSTYWNNITIFRISLYRYILLLAY